MFGKMNNSKWNKVFEELTMYDVTIKTTRFADEKIIHPAEICDECLFAYNYPENKILYKDILYIKIDCPPEKASKIQNIGKMDSEYSQGVLFINGY